MARRGYGRFFEEFWRDANVAIPVFGLLFFFVGSEFSSKVLSAPEGSFLGFAAYPFFAGCLVCLIWGDKGLSPRRVHPQRQGVYWVSHGLLFAGSAVVASWFWTVVSSGGGAWIRSVEGLTNVSAMSVLWVGGLAGLWWSATPAALVPKGLSED